jgi:hypothetical protein
MLVSYPTPYHPTPPPYYPTPPSIDNRGIHMSIDNTQKDTHMNTQDAQSAIDRIIDRTLVMIEEGVDRNVGDMTLMKSLEFIGILMDIRERQQAHMKRTQKKVRMCGKACTKMPKRK